MGENYKTIVRFPLSSLENTSHFGGFKVFWHRWRGGKESSTECAVLIISTRVQRSGNNEFRFRFFVLQSPPMSWRVQIKAVVKFCLTLFPPKVTYYFVNRRGESRLDYSHSDDNNIHHRQRFAMKNCLIVDNVTNIELIMPNVNCSVLRKQSCT